MTTAEEKHTVWLAAEIQAAIDDPRHSIPHGKVMAGMGAQLARLKERQDDRTHGAERAVMTW